MKHLRWSFLQKKLTVFTVDFFCKTLHNVFHRVMNMLLVRLNKILVRCHLIHKKIGLQSLQISSTFEFNIIFTLHCGETLLITNSIHVFDFKLIHHLNTYDINQPLFTCSNSSKLLQINF